MPPTRHRSSARCWAVPTSRSQLAWMYSGGPPIWATTAATFSVGTISIASQGQTISSYGLVFLLGNVDADLAADAPLQVDLAPLLRALDDAAVDRLELDAVDRADLQARLAAGAVVGVDDRQLFGNLFAGTCFGHDDNRGLNSRGQVRLPGAVERFDLLVECLSVTAVAWPPPPTEALHEISHNLSLCLALGQGGLRQGLCAFLRRQRESHQEFAALSRPVAHRCDRAPVQLDQGPHQCQADPQPGR